VYSKYRMQWCMHDFPMWRFKLPHSLSRSSPPSQFPFHSSLPVPSPSLLSFSVNPARGSGERCKLPQRVGGVHPPNAFCCILRLKTIYFTIQNAYKTLFAEKPVNQKIRHNFTCFGLILSYNFCSEKFLSLFGGSNPKLPFVYTKRAGKRTLVTSMMTFTYFKTITP